MRATDACSSAALEPYSIALLLIAALYKQVFLLLSLLPLLIAVDIFVATRLAVPYPFQELLIVSNLYIIVLAMRRELLTICN